MAGTRFSAARACLVAVLGLLVACCAVAANEATTAPSSQAPQRLVLQHRTDASTSAWTTRGYVSLQNATSGSFEQVSRASDLLASGAHRDGSYLLRLVREEDTGSAEITTAGQVVRTKLCLLDALVPGSFSSDVLSLILSSQQPSSSVPTFSYSIVGLPPLDASDCPKTPIPRRGGSAGSRDTQLKVLVEPREQAIGASLRPAPRPRLDGASGAEVPPPEKSFLQKYWFYILPILVLLALPSEGPPSSSQQPPANAGARQIR